MKTMTQEFSMNLFSAWQSAATAVYGPLVVRACATPSTVAVEGVAVRAADEARRLRVAHVAAEARTSAVAFAAAGAFAARPQGKGLGLTIPATEAFALPGPSAWSPPV